MPIQEKPAIAGFSCLGTDLGQLTAPIDEMI